MSMSDNRVEHGKPTDGMCCLCTMEDITNEENNYVEYQCYPSLKWKPCFFEKNVVEVLLGKQFDQYVNQVKKTNCQAELRRLLKIGPPIYISDKHGFPLELEGGDEYVCTLWYADDGKEHSSMLVGALEGGEREELWESLREFLILEGKEEGDDDEKKD